MAVLGIILDPEGAAFDVDDAMPALPSLPLNSATRRRIAPACLSSISFVSTTEGASFLTIGGFEISVLPHGRTLIPTAISIPPAAISAPLGKSPTTYSASLTVREVKVLRLVAQGMTNQQAAEQPVISPRTVNTHLTAIYGKIGISSRYAIEHSLV